MVQVSGSLLFLESVDAGAQQECLQGEKKKKIGKENMHGHICLNIGNLIANNLR